MSLGDLISGGNNTLAQLAQMGRADPSAQGSPPGGPGSPGGAQVAFPQNGVPSAASQSPPDLAQLYLKLYQQNRNADSFDRGLANIAAAYAAPGTGGQVFNSLAPQGHADPGAMLGNLVQLEQMQRMQQARPAMVNYLTGGAAGAAAPGATPGAAAGGAAPAAGGDPNLAAVLGAQSPETLQRMVDQKLQSGLQIQQQGAEDKQKNLIDAQGGLADTQKTLGALDANIDAIKNATNADGSPVLQSIISTPWKQRAAMTIMNSEPPEKEGALQQYWSAATQQLAQAGLSQPEIDTIMTMKQLKGQQYASAINSIKGGRRTQVEIGAVAGGLSQIGDVNQTFDDGKGGGYLPNLNKFQQQVRGTMANAYGEAGQLDNLDPKYRFGADGKPLVNPVYQPGGPLYGGQGGQWVTQPPPQAGPKGATAGQPATITGPADIAKLPHGAPFLIPSGPNQGKIGYAQ